MALTDILKFFKRKKRFHLEYIARPDIDEGIIEMKRYDNITGIEIPFERGPLYLETISPGAIQKYKNTP